jgi:hypothetical protein
MSHPRRKGYVLEVAPLLRLRDVHPGSLLPVLTGTSVRGQHAIGLGWEMVGEPWCGLS